MRWLIALVLCTSLPVASASAGQPEWWRSGGPRLRPQEPRITSLLEEGGRRSAMLRSLIERIEAGDVFVYIAANRLMNPHLAGSLQWMTTTGPYRYLRVSIDPGLSADQMIATLGHELQHVVEVSDDPGVVDDASLAALYRRIGHPSPRVVGSSWESDAAQAAGQQVRRELAATPASTVARLNGGSRR